MGLFKPFGRYSKHSPNQISHPEYGCNAFVRNIVTWMKLLYRRWRRTLLRNVWKSLLYYAV